MTSILVIRYEGCIRFEFRWNFCFFTEVQTCEAISSEDIRDCAFSDRWLRSEGPSERSYHICSSNEQILSEEIASQVCTSEKKQKFHGNSNLIQPSFYITDIDVIHTFSYMSRWKSMICSWCVYEGFNKMGLVQPNTARSTMATVTAPWRHSIVPMSYPYTQAQQQSSPVIYAASIVRWEFETIEIIVFSSCDCRFYCVSCCMSRPRIESNSPFPTIYCLYHVYEQVYDWLLQVMYGEVMIQGQQYRFASSNEKLAPEACRFESHDIKSIINLSNKVTLNLPHQYMGIKWKRLKAFRMARNWSISVAFGLVLSSKQKQNQQITLTFQQMGQFPQFLSQYS